MGSMALVIDKTKSAGRPPLYDAPMIVKPISLPADYWQYLLDEFGGYSPGIRQLIEEHQERKTEANTPHRGIVARDGERIMQE